MLWSLGDPSKVQFNTEISPLWKLELKPIEMDSMGESQQTELENASWPFGDIPFKQSL